MSLRAKLAEVARLRAGGLISQKAEREIFQIMLEAYAMDVEVACMKELKAKLNVVKELADSGLVDSEMARQVLDACATHAKHLWLKFSHIENET